MKDEAVFLILDFLTGVTAFGHAFFLQRRLLAMTVKPLNAGPACTTGVFFTSDETDSTGSASINCRSKRDYVSQNGIDFRRIG